MDSSAYKDKCKTMLQDSNTYKVLTRDPTTKYKKEHADFIRELKDNGEIDFALSRQPYPTTDTPPKFYGLPKVHKPDMPLRPIVSSVGSITYNCAKYLARVLSPLVGQTEHHVKNTQQFASVIKDKTVEEDEILVSYDVSALFTSVPVDKTLIVKRDRLVADDSLKERTPLSPERVTRLLELCLNCTYFVYDSTYCLQIHGAAMGSPVSPIVCNLYMEHFEALALSTAPHPPGWWYRYVDDTHTKQKKEYVSEFTDHINSLDPDIKFTVEEENNGTLAFLDTNSIRQPDGSIKTTVYRKATHTDQYLDFESAHPDEHKLGVVRTLHQRAETVISNKRDLAKEKQHVNKALAVCKYPKWAIQKVSSKLRKAKDSIKEKVTPKKRDSRGSIFLPYIKGKSETLKRVFGKHKINVCFKPHRTLRQILVHPKDKTKKEDICGPIYHITCDGQGDDKCDSDYTGETERNLKARFMEHRRPSSSTSEVSRHLHKDKPGHCVSLESVKILDREPSWFERGVKEAVYIRAHKPALNRDGGRHNLPHIWDATLTSLTTIASSGVNPQ